MKTFAVTLLILLLSMVPAIAEKNTMVETALHYFTTDESVTLVFDVAENADDYEVFLYSIDRKEYNFRWVVTAEEGATTVSMPLQLPRTGFYKIMLRSRRNIIHSEIDPAIDAKTIAAELLTYIQHFCGVGDWWDETLPLDQLKTLAKQESHICGEFNDSTDGSNSLVIDPDSGVSYNRGWTLFGYPAPPSGGGVSIQ